MSTDNILHVTHSWGGGIPAYLEDLKGILQEEFTFFFLKCDDGKVILEHGKNQEKMPSFYNLPRPLGIADFHDAAYRERIALILKNFNIRLVHVSSTVGHTFDVFEVPKQLDIPLLFTVHDFYYICPTFHMVDKDGLYCSGCELNKERDNCLKNHPYIVHQDFNKSTLNRWRHEFLRIEPDIDFLVFPSFSAKEIFCDFFNIREEKCRVIYHGIHSERREFEYRPHSGEVLRVGILGSMLRHKGEPLIKYILSRINDADIEFHHFGDGNLKAEKLVNHGPYDRSGVVELLREKEIDVMLLLSTWHETFSYTLSESMAANIPPIVTNMGALKERLEDKSFGWIVDYDDPEKICELLRFLRKNRHEIKERRDRMKDVHFTSMVEMKKEYLDVYRSILSKNDDGTKRRAIRQDKEKNAEGEIPGVWQKWKRRLLER